MEIYYPIIVFVLTFLAGTYTVFYVNKSGPWVKNLLSFSGAYIFGITVLHILPEAYEYGNSFKYIAIFVLVGFFIQIILEYFSQGVEHGHIHIHFGQKFPYSLFLALMVHEFMEGNLLNHNHHENEPNTALAYFLGLIIHKIPIAIVLGIIIKNSAGKMMSILAIFVFSLATPAGAYLSLLLSENVVNIANAVVAGSFLHISTTILFESTPEHRFDFPKFLMAIIGALASLLLL